MCQFVNKLLAFHGERQNKNGSSGKLQIVTERHKRAVSLLQTEFDTALFLFLFCNKR